MKASGNRLREIIRPNEGRAIRPVSIPFASTDRALASVEAGRTKGMVAIRLK
jgi:hypothetical protein